MTSDEARQQAKNVAETLARLRVVRANFLARHNALVSKVQEDCPHPTMTFVPDPSGGGDSYHECLWCGLKDYEISEKEAP